MKIPPFFLSLAVIGFVIPFALADVTLPALISDHMVLEKTAKVPIWGKAEPGESVTVTLDKQSVTGVADAEGKWKVILNLADSSVGPFELTVAGKNTLTVKDVVVGEVWLASGQSNMQWALKGTANSEAAIAGSANPMLREFAVARNPSAEPVETLVGTWMRASPETTGAFSAVGYYFGKKLQAELQVPVGIIHSSWGGTPVESWTSNASLTGVPDLKASKDRMLKRNEVYPEAKRVWVESIEAWLKTTNRADRPTDPSAFAGIDASTDDWVSVKLPGVPEAAGIPVNGAIWLRQTIEIPEKNANTQVGIDLGTFDGFDSVYWNGELVTTTSIADFPGKGFQRRYGRYSIPPKLIKAGPNVLAIRVFSPVSPFKFGLSPRLAGAIPISTEWLAKAEFALPALTPEELAQAPLPPDNAIAPHNLGSHLYNGMIAPVIPFAISGVIWYQGESNAGRAWQYRTTFPLMISGWREAWDQGDFPFYFCQLANYRAKQPVPTESSWAELRDAQSNTLSLPNTGQAVLIDIGESDDIHPRNKADVGERLALVALAKDYGKDVPHSGPVYDSKTVDGNQVRLRFQHTNGGLVAKPLPIAYDVNTFYNKTAPLTRNSPESELEGFAICGEDKVWVWADAKIDGDAVLVWSDKVAAPVAVRYAWADNPTVNLYNGAGLPAAPFRTDDFPASTLNAKY